MFWKKKKVTIDKKFKKQVLEELKILRNGTVLLLREIDKLVKQIKEERL
tara:strand:+ start:200 stop:346 length:147 start_codon:yes stop_codon:yes gene_type:complete